MNHGTHSHPYSIRTTEAFDQWFSRLRDRRAKARILARIDRFESGNPGDIKSLGDGVSEMRISHGPGYRIYYTQRGDVIVILLCGGDKSTQTRDIKKAKEMAQHLDVE